MSNQEIINTAAIQCGIYSKEEVADFEANFQRLPLHTYAEWKKMGYQVRKGEHAVLKCKIFMYRGDEPGDGSDTDPEKEVKGSFYMKSASFFRREQVDKIDG